MPAPTAVTQRDVAEACGVHPSTICLALKNSPSIPLPTRQRIQALALELGYQPNVAARNLALLRTEKTGGGNLPIAWINQEPHRTHWRTDDRARPIFDRARQRAEESGYHLDEIWTREPGMNVPRLIQIIRARGISGVIFPVHRTFDFSLIGPAWSDLSLMGLNDQRLAEWIDVACPDHYRQADALFRQVRQQDLGRVGLLLTPHLDAASSGSIHSCFLRHQSDLVSSSRVPLCLLPEDATAKAEVFDKWFRDHRPDVMISAEPDLATRARAMGLPGLWMGLSSAAAPGFDGGMAGSECAAASAAVDSVIGKMRRFETGTSETTRLQLIKGAWHGPRIALPELEKVVA